EFREEERELGAARHWPTKPKAACRGDRLGAPLGAIALSFGALDRRRRTKGSEKADREGAPGQAGTLSRGNTMKPSKGFVWAALLAIALAPAAHASPPPLLPRTFLFGEPESGAPSLSPDGHWLCLARRDSSGIVNLWVRGLDRDTSWQVTFDRKRGVHGARWTPLGDRLLYLADSDGDENGHVFAVDISSGHVRDLTPLVGARAEGIHLDSRVPDAMLVGLNVRDPHFFDLYRVDLVTGAVALEAENPGDVIEWTAGPGLHANACTALRRGDVATVLRVRHRSDAMWRDLVTWPFEQA